MLELSIVKLAEGKQGWVKLVQARMGGVVSASPKRGRWELKARSEMKGKKND